MDDSCAVCAENLDWVAYGSCGHREVCSTCVVRLRFILNDHRCCICKTECPVVFVTKALGDYTKTISDFSILPSTPKEGRVGSYWYHEETKVFFDVLDQYTKIKTMCRLSCSSCDNNTTSTPRIQFKSVEHLTIHLNNKHKLHMCSLCLVGRKVFICEQKLFTKKQLNRHISSGDSEVDGSESERGGFTGHPKCEFCKIPFYGGNELYTHMSREHYTCHICQRLKPGQYEYYGNYNDLEVHFRNDHFLCEDESCLAKKFIVFQIESELKKHNAIDHGSRMSRSQLRASLQIEASFQVHYNRRRERERSSQTSQPSSGGLRGLAESSFPPLSAQANRNQSRSGQNSENLLSNTQRAWPALNRGSGQSSSVSSQSQSRNQARFANTTRALASSSAMIPHDARNEHTGVVGGSSSGSAKRNHHLPSQGVSDVVQRSDANKSLVETIRASLGKNEETFMAFKDISGKYRHGSIDATTYLEYVKGFGLSHLVLDMAKLCPDLKRQKELIDTHNASSKAKGKVVESSSDSIRVDSKISKDRSDKGKTKVISDSSTSGNNTGKQQCKKTNLKFHRARLDEKPTASVLHLRTSNNAEQQPEPESKNGNSKSRNQNLTGSGLPRLRGAWRKGTAKQLFL